MPWKTSLKFTASAEVVSAPHSKTATETVTGSLMLTFQVLSAQALSANQEGKHHDANMARQITTSSDDFHTERALQAAESTLSLTSTHTTNQRKESCTERPLVVLTRQRGVVAQEGVFLALRDHEINLPHTRTAQPLGEAVLVENLLRRTGLATPTPLLRVTNRALLGEKKMPTESPASLR